MSFLDFFTLDWFVSLLSETAVWQELTAPRQIQEPWKRLTQSLCPSQLGVSCHLKKKKKKKVVGALHKERGHQGCWQTVSTLVSRETSWYLPLCHLLPFLFILALYNAVNVRLSFKIRKKHIELSSCLTLTSST